MIQINNEKGNVSHHSYEYILMLIFVALKALFSFFPYEA